jgi:hypothetical protein
MSARKGDMVCSPFQCDYCWFANIAKKEASDWFPEDARKLAYIRRVNLDIMWSREPSTVSSTLNNLLKARQCSKDLGFTEQTIQIGPWPIADTCGFQTAIEMIKQSQGKGRNVANYVQFDSIRKTRAAYANAYDASPSRCLDNRRMKSDRGQFMSFVNGPTDSRLFSMFMSGCERRMGRFVKQDLGISLPMLLAILELYEADLRNAEVTNKRKRWVILCAAAFVILWSGALRGGEIFLLEASELIKRRNDGRNMSGDLGHCVIPLMGRFKQETGERNLIIVLANKTKGGLDVRKWVDLLTGMLLAEGREGEVGPALCNEDGFMIDRWRLNEELHFMMNKIQELGTGLIPTGVDVDERFNVYRSFRRGATKRAKEQGVDEATIEMNNRWRKWQNKQGSLPNLPMSQLYVEISQVLTSKLRFSRCL